MTPDLINALFEFLGGVFILNHVRLLLKQKTVSGVSVLSTAFFLGWGFWNLFFYPHLGQMLSFAAGVFLTVTQLLYVFLLLYYK